MPGRILLDELNSSSSSGGGGDCGSLLRRTSSTGLPSLGPGAGSVPGLQRTSSTGAPGSSTGVASSLRRTSSTGLPSASSSRQGGGHKPAPASSLHRLSASARRPGSSGDGTAGEAAGGSQLVTPEKQQPSVVIAVDASGVATDTPFHLSLEDSACPAHRQPGAAASHLSLDSPVARSTSTQQ